MCLGCQCVSKKAKNDELNLNDLDKTNDHGLANSKKNMQDPFTGLMKPATQSPRKNRRTKSCNKLNERNKNQTEILDDDIAYNYQDTNKNIINVTNAHQNEKTKDKDTDNNAKARPRSIKSSNLLKGLRKDLMKSAF